jgi:predicted metal-dependent hydrolase
MSLATKLGPNYESVRAVARIKTIKIEVNDSEFELKVRVPVKREMEELTNKIRNPSKELIESIYIALAKPLRDSIGDNPEFLEALKEEKEIKVLDNDIVVQGTSVRSISELTASWQTQVELYFGLLQTPTGVPITETFEEISEEFPEVAIKEIIAKIDSAIRPNYQDTKKN